VSPRAVLLALGLTALVAQPAAAESWVLWAQLVPAPTAAIWTPDPPRTVGVYPTPAACLAAARPLAEAMARQNVTEWRAVTAGVSATQHPPTQTSNPPGVQITQEVTIPGPNFVRNEDVVIVTQCWPVGVTPQ